MFDRSTPPQPSEVDTPVLEGWKAIATYLNRDVRTAKRWEVNEGLPVHRLQHLARSSVYAYPAELDAGNGSGNRTRSNPNNGRLRVTCVH